MTTQHADAWAFVAEHAQTIRRYTQGTRFRPRHVEPDEYHQDFIVQVVRAFHRYNPSASAPATWLGWQARAVAQTHMRARARRLAEVPCDEDTPLVCSGDDVYQRARVAQVLGRASIEEREACMTILAGLDGGQVKAAIGVSRPARDFRVRKFAKRLNEENIE